MLHFICANLHNQKYFHVYKKKTINNKKKAINKNVCYCLVANFMQSSPYINSTIMKLKIRKINHLNV